MDVLRRNNVTVTGVPDGPPLVLAHGFGTDQSVWRLVVPELVADHRVVLLDHVGCGGSDPAAFDPRRYTSLWAYAEDVVEVLEALDLTAVAFVGHSASAMIGVLASIAAPERFDRLVLLGPSPRYVEDEDYAGGFTRADVDAMLEEIAADWPGWAARMAPLLVGTEERDDAAAELETIFRRTRPEAAHVFARTALLSDERATLARSTVRSLILATRDDLVVPGAIAEYLHEHLADSDLVFLEAVGHMPNLSAPRATAAAIRAFL